MDEKTKQKVLIGVVVVLGLGWGTYTFVLKDSGGPAPEDANRGPAVRRAVADTGTVKKTTRRKARPNNKARGVLPARRAERRTSEPTGAKRNMRRGKKKNVKKAKIIQAA